MTGSTERPADERFRRFRRPEPAFARAVATALGDAGTIRAATVLDVRGAVPYAPPAHEVRQVDPPTERLPFADGRFDAAGCAFTVQDWPDVELGLAEVRRVTSGPVVVLTRDPERMRESWLTEYAPEVVEADARRHPSIDRIRAALGSAVTTARVPIPFTCVDGFSEAYAARPERLLDAGARAADPAWGLVDELTARRSVAALATALETGDWDRRHGALRIRPAIDGSVVLLRATPA